MKRGIAIEAQEKSEALSEIRELRDERDAAQARVAELVAALERAATAMWNSEANMDNAAAEAEEAIGNAKSGAPVAQAGQVPDRLELTEDLKNILGRPNFTCTHLAEVLRQIGFVIDRKSEAEQAACLHWMLNHYLAHGADWRAHAEAELKAVAPAQGGE